MSATDTLKAVQTLQEAGFDEKQAKAIVSAKDQSGKVARSDLANLRVEMYKMAVGIVVATTTLTVALIKIL